jgi:hydrogenase maturation protein HypF
MACAWLTDAYGREPELPPTFTAHVTEQRWREVARLALSGLASPTTTSIGRLFDAIAALCGIRTTVSYEGQAAIELEAQAWRAPAELPYPLPLLERDGAPLVLDARPTVIAALEDVSAGRDPAVVAGRFHEALACATAESCTRIAAAHGIGTVVLSGGVFQNRLLLERTAVLLVTAGLRVLAPELLPPNDGGISYGQAAVAAASAGR